MLHWVVIILPTNLSNSLAPQLLLKISNSNLTLLSIVKVEMANSTK